MGLLTRGDGRVRAYGLAITLALLASLAVPAPAQAVDIRYKEKPVAGWSTNGSVFAVALVGEVVYVGGAFTKAVSGDGDVERDRKNLAAFDRISGELLDFRADTNGAVRGIAGDGTTVWIGGTFTQVDGRNRDRVAALNATTGAVRNSFDPEVDGHVWHVEYANGRVYIGGEFREVDGVSQRRVASLHPTTGAPDSDFEARASGTVRSLAYSEARDTLYVGGSFTSIGGSSRDQLAGIDPNTGDIKGANLDTPDSLVFDVDVSDDGAYVFAAVGGNKNRAQAWNASSGSKRWHRTAMGDVQAISYEDNRVYFGFHEGFGGSTNVKLLAANASSGSMDNSFRPSVNSFFGIWDIDAAPGALIAGGEFSRVEGVRTKGSAIFPRSGIPDLEPPSRVTGIHAANATATSIEVAWTPATDDVGINGYIVRRDGQIVETVPTAVFLDTGLDPQTEYVYTVEALDSVNRSGGVSDPATLETWSRIVAAGSTWAYFDSGSPPSGWKNRTFNDSGWATGPAQLGFGENDEETELERGEMAYYFRHEFVTPGGRELLDATLGLVRDDGAVVYINGVEVMRSNMPGGTIGHETAAASSTSGSDESRFFGAAVDPDVFLPGINVLAVEVHQRTPNSSDISFDLRLDGELSDQPFDQIPPSAASGLTANATSASSIRLTWNAATDNRGIDGYIVRRNGQDIGYTSQRNFVDSGLDPDTNYRYRVVAVDTSLNQGPPTPVVQESTEPDTTRPSRPKQLRLTAATGTSLSIKWNKATDDVGVSHYVVKLDGEAIATTSSRSYVITGLDPETEYHVAVRAVDTSGNKGFKAHLYESTAPFIVRTELIRAGASWKFLDDGSNQGTAWQLPGFIAATWSSGSSELGYGDGDEATEVDDGPNNDRHITTYFRRKFTVPDRSAVQVLQLRVVRDDGVVVHLNGTEVFRDNLPGGAIGHNTKALESLSGADEREWIVVTIPKAALRNGKNTLAVEIHQSGPRSSDISFNLELIANPQAV